MPINYAKPLLSVLKEEELSSLPKRSGDGSQLAGGSTPGAPVEDPGKLAVKAMSKIADQIRACEGFSVFSPAKEKKLNFYYRAHWDPPTDVRYDVKPSDSLVAPFQGIAEFSVHSGVAPCLRADDDASCSPDRTPLSITTRYRYFYRITGSTAQLDYRTYFDNQQQNWRLQQGKSVTCWEQLANQ